MVDYLRIQGMLHPHGLFGEPAPCSTVRSRPVLHIWALPTSARSCCWPALLLLPIVAATALLKPLAAGC